MAVTIEDIERARQRIKDAVVLTPLHHSAELNERTGASVWIKPESLQHIGAFKFRGAYNRLCQFDAQQKSLGAVAFSSGNHAQGMAYAAKLLGIEATIVMPSDAPAIKLAGTKKHGARIVPYDRRSESREKIAEAIAHETGAVLVPAYDDEDIIAGQGTLALELMEQLRASNRGLDILLSPCGGGGLLAGVSTAIKARSPGTEVYGVEPQGYDDHYRSLQAGERVAVDTNQHSICDALMAPTPGEITWKINSQLVSGFLRVSEADVRHAISFAFRYLKLVIEPGAAVALAALLQGKTAEIHGGVGGKSVAIILSGGNIDPQILQDCLDEYPSP